MVRHMEQSSQRRQSFPRFPSKGSALGIDLRQGRGKRFSLRISLEGVDFRLQSRSTLGFKIIYCDSKGEHNTIKIIIGSVTYRGKTHGTKFTEEIKSLAAGARGSLWEYFGGAQGK